jgi:hypothetical protein
MVRFRRGPRDLCNLIHHLAVAIAGPTVRCLRCILSCQPNVRGVNNCRNVLQHFQSFFANSQGRTSYFFEALAILKRNLLIFNEAIFDSKVDR